MIKYTLQPKDRHVYMVLIWKMIVMVGMVSAEMNILKIVFRIESQPIIF